MIMKKTIRPRSRLAIASLFTILLLPNNIAAWNWPWGKTKTIEDKQLELQRKQIDDPTNPYINYNIGVAAYKKKQYDTASASFGRAIQNAPDKQIFKKQAHFNLGQAQYHQALDTVGSSWQTAKLSDETIDKAIAFTVASIKEFDAVLVLETEHPHAKKMKAEVELFQQKLLAKKYENKDNKDKKDQNNDGKKNQQQGKGQGDSKDQQQGGQDSNGDQKDGQKNKPQDGQDKQSGNDKNDQNSQNGQQNGNDKQSGKDKDGQGKDDQNKDNGTDQANNSKQDKQDGQSQDKDSGKNNTGAQDKQQADQQPNDQAKGNQNNGKAEDNEKEGKQAGARGNHEDKKEDNGREEAPGEAAGEQIPGTDVMDHALDAHAKSVLDAVEQAEGNAQKRAMAAELSKMRQAGIGGNQKPW